jgi:RNA polymerase sigma factor (sigma-70 family)
VEYEGEAGNSGLKSWCHLRLANALCFGSDCDQGPKHRFICALRRDCFGKTRSSRHYKVGVFFEGRIMQTAALKRVLAQLRQQAGVTAFKDLSDADLLELFRVRREEAAFTLLVQRHGPMVLGVCRRVLGNSHAAEDAFQNTFLVLVRKAGSLRKPQSLGSWLYGVAYRTASQALRQACQRHVSEQAAIVSRTAPDALEALSQAELYAVLDEEISRLADKHRRPLILCCLEGKTYEQAAQEMAWPISTVAARLKRACELLRQQLARRGITLPVGAVAALLAEQVAARAVPALLILSTVRLAAQTLAGQAATALPIVTFISGMVKGMTTTKLGVAITLLLTVSLAVAGVGVLASPKQEPKTETPLRETRRPGPPKSEPVEAPPTDLYGDPLPAGALARFGTARLHHAGTRQVLFDADGKTLLSTGHDLKVRRWELSSGKLVALQSFTLPPDEPFRELSAPVLSPDGKTLAYVAAKQLFFFDAVNGKELHRLPVDTEQGQGSVPARAFTPDGKQFAFTNTAGKFLLFDVASGKPVPTGVQITQSRMNKAILCGHRYPSIADESVQQLRLKLQVNEG